MPTFHEAAQKVRNSNLEPVSVERSDSSSPEEQAARNEPYRNELSAASRILFRADDGLELEEPV